MTPAASASWPRLVLLAPLSCRDARWWHVVALTQKRSGEAPEPMAVIHLTRAKAHSTPTVEVGPQTDLAALRALGSTFLSTTRRMLRRGRRWLRASGILPLDALSPRANAQHHRRSSACGSAMPNASPPEWCRKVHAAASDSRNSKIGPRYGPDTVKRLGVILARFWR